MQHGVAAMRTTLDRLNHNVSVVIYNLAGHSCILRGRRRAAVDGRGGAAVTSVAAVGSSAYVSPSICPQP